MTTSRVQGVSSSPVVSVSQYLTLAFSYFTVGVTVSVTLVERDVDPWLILAAGLFVHSATSELAHVAVIDAGGPLLAGVASGWLVAARFGVLAASLEPRLRSSTPWWHRAGIAANAFDPNTALALNQSDNRDVRRAFWWVTSALVLGWWVGSITGVLLGNVLHDAKSIGLDVVFPAALLAVIGGQLRSRSGLVTALISGGLLILSLPYLPAGAPILVAVFGAAAGALWPNRPSARDNDDQDPVRRPGTTRDDIR